MFTTQPKLGLAQNNLNGSLFNVKSSRPILLGIVTRLKPLKIKLSIALLGFGSQNHHTIYGPKLSSRTTMRTVSPKIKNTATGPGRHGLRLIKGHD